MWRHNYVFGCIDCAKSLLTNQNNGMSSYLIIFLINCQVLRLCMEMNSNWNNIGGGHLDIYISVFLWSIIIKQ